MGNRLGNAVKAVQETLRSNWWATPLAFSVLAYLLAILPWLGQVVSERQFLPFGYRIDVAVLTATLIALIWYAAFTYRQAKATESSLFLLSAEERAWAIEALQQVTTILRKWESQAEKWRDNLGQPADFPFQQADILAAKAVRVGGATADDLREALVVRHGLSQSYSRYRDAPASQKDLRRAELQQAARDAVGPFREARAISELTRQQLLLEASRHDLLGV